MAGDKTKTYLFFGFVFSLVLNGFLLGFLLAGPFWRPGAFPPPDPARRLYEAAGRLGPETREAVIAVLDRRSAEVDENMRKNMEEFKEIRVALTAPDQTPEGLATLFQRLGRQHEKTGEIMGIMFGEIAKAIPDEQERIAFFRDALPPEPPGPPPAPPRGVSFPQHSGR